MNKFLDNLINSRKKIFPNLDLSYQFYILNKLGIDEEYKLKNYLKACEYMPLLKVAYPHKHMDITQSTYDINKWLVASSQIYSMHLRGINLSEAIHQIIGNWNSKEQKDFKNWLSFYQQQGHLKYKKAQVYPNSFLKATIPGVPTPENTPNYRPQIQESKQIDLEQKQLLAKKIQGIVGRLSAAEKIATDPEIREILKQRLDIDLNSWLELLHKVKRTIQTAPIKNVYSSLLEDLIFKEANFLIKNGRIKTAKELIFLAQDTATAPPLPAQQVSLPEESINDGKKPIDDFIEAINGDYSKLDDSNDIIDPIDDDLANIKILAQEAINNDIIHKEQNKIDDAFDEALKNVTVQDVIDALERLANLLRNREIPRILSKVDLMMNQLNISSFFPTLAEASNKSLESNQYALTRIDDILSKLKGIINSPTEINLSELQGEPISNQNIIQNQLKIEQDKEKALKQKRKQEQMEQELNGPAAQQQNQTQINPSPELAQTNPQIQQTKPQLPA